MRNKIKYSIGNGESVIVLGFCDFPLFDFTSLRLSTIYDGLR